MNKPIRVGDTFADEDGLVWTCIISKPLGVRWLQHMTDTACRQYQTTVSEIRASTLTRVTPS